MKEDMDDFPVGFQIPGEALLLYMTQGLKSKGSSQKLEMPGFHTVLNLIVKVVQSYPILCDPMD